MLKLPEPRQLFDRNIALQMALRVVPVSEPGMHAKSILEVDVMLTVLRKSRKSSLFLENINKYHLGFALSLDALWRKTTEMQYDFEEHAQCIGHDCKRLRAL